MIDSAPAAERKLLIDRVSGLWRRFRLGRLLGVALPLAALVAGIATYVALSDTDPLGSEPEDILYLLYVDFVLLLALAIVVIRRIVKLWLARRRGSAGSRLHSRLSFLFGLVAVAPTMFVLLFSVMFISSGIQDWFSERVASTLEAADAAAQGYLKEHQQNIRADVLRAARDINRDARLLEANPRLLNQAINLQAQVRGLTEAIVFDSTGKVLARSGLTFALEFEIIESAYIESARAGEVPIFLNDSEDRVRALVRLDSFLDAYLFVGRFVDATVLSHTEQTRNAVSQFYKLKDRSTDIQISFTLMFLLVALLLVTAAVWMGLNVATDISRPISELIAAVDKVGEGDLSARVREPPPGDEIGSLSRAFNRMTDQLTNQRHDLIEANRQLDERRQFTETVLSGVSAGVIGVDLKGNIDLPNRSAARLLGLEIGSMVGEPLDKVIPEFAALFHEAKRRRDQPTESQIKITRAGSTRTLLVAIAAEQLSGKVIGYVVTFDDVSELLEAQWKGAWADVARRIAHEIRNPLTPIQLSAERLKRKYMEEITSDRETFEICTDTIVRRVDDIGRMIEEFSNFARMPAPILRLENLSELSRQAMFLQRSAHPEIDFVAVMPEEPQFVSCDGRQLAQVITNLLKNAAEALERGNGNTSEQPRVIMRLIARDDRVVIEVEDNGPGLPQEGREKLTEPYVTMRHAGTGLGLAIVRKIMEDHGGTLALEDAEGGGALIRIELPKDGKVGAQDRRQIAMGGPAVNGS
ncbi:MAG: PAS domain-containing sensor histidine kinase [Rhodospirillales bacterium]|nr:MAG: PAS domain-containing sensor histidine kinase [Rhodospirillales bacterium]